MNRKPKLDFKPKYSCVKPEDIHLGLKYSFSYNPEDQPLFEKFYKMKLNTLNDWSQKYEDIFTTLKYCKISIYLEISSNARFHWHGYIEILNIVPFLLHDCAKLKHYGTYEIDIIKDPLIWDKYITKQKSFMEIYCNKNDLKYYITS